MGTLKTLLLVLLCGVLVSCYELPDMSRRRMYKKTDAGCAYQGQMYSNGASIETPEPCLNCTCVNSLLVCYLRICPTVKPPGPGCLAARKPKECCPSFICGEKATSEPDETLELRPTFQPVTPKPDDSPLYITSDIPDFLSQNDEPVNTSKGCLVNGTLYGDGSAMLSNAFCEYCFCIKGKSRCLKPKCNLEIKGCTPRYDSHYTCCPTRYHCGSQKTATGLNSKINKPFSSPIDSSNVSTDIVLSKDATDENTTFKNATSADHENVHKNISMLTTTSPLETETILGFCVVDQNSYEIGESMPDYRPCHNCYCTASGIVCQRIQCSQKISGCEPIIPDGYCCPVSYKCDNDEKVNSVALNHINNSISHSISKGTGIKTGVTQLSGTPSKGSNKDLDITLKEDLKPVFVNSVPLYRKSDEEELAVSLSFSPEEAAYDDNEELHKISVNVKEIISMDNYTDIQETETTLVMSTSSESDLSSFYEVTDIDESAVTTSKNVFSVSTNETEKVESVLIGSPEVHTVEITDLLNKLFSQTANQSNLPTVMSFSVERNNSKKPSSIMNDLPSLEKNESHYWALENNTRENDTLYTQLLTKKPESVGEITLELSTHGFISKQPEEDLQHTTLLFFTPIIENSFESTDTSHILNKTPTSFNINSAQENETTLPFKSTTNEQREETTTQDITLHKSTTEQQIRLNSKVSLESPTKNNTKSNTTVHLTGVWKDPVSELSFTSTEVIFEDRSEVTLSDVMSSTTAGKELLLESHSTLTFGEEENKTSFYPPQPQGNKSPTDEELISGEVKLSQFTTQSTTNEVTINEAKKGPRIQDQYNKLSTEQGYDIIPFVAQDAIRGQHVKVNGSTDDSTGSPPDMISDFCFIKGRIYMNGEMVTKADPCELCRCFYGRELCQKQKCPVQPECQPEKVPGFCCPRFTCAKNMTAESPAKNTFATSSAYSPPAITPYPRPQDRNPALGITVQEKPPLKYGIRVRPRPTQLYPSLKPTTRQTTRITEPSKVTPKPESSTENINSFTRFVKDITTKGPDVTQNTFSNSYEQARTTYETPDFLVTTLNRNGATSSKTSVRTTTEQAELQFVPDPWGLLKVSGCNIYGKFFKINDQVEILSGPCSHCICTTNGVECNDIC